jgi:lactoylglutathione lyase
MFSHIFVSVSDFEKSYRFYSAVMTTLGIEQRFYEPDRPWAGWQSTDNSRPYFVITQPFNGEPHHPGNGQMVAFLAKTPSAVRSAYDIAIERGGTCEGPPGPRPEYHEHYYGAYFRDFDGNKLCVASHDPE